MITWYTMVEKGRHFMDRLVYANPSNCPVCGRVLVFTGDFVCMACREKLEWLADEDRCAVCGRKNPYPESDLCRDCSLNDHYFKRGYSLWTYGKYAKRVVADVKYHGQRALAVETGKCLGRALKTLTWFQKTNIIIPTPLHVTKYQKRGYNQAYLIAKGLGEECGKPVEAEVLLQTRETQDQIGLGRTERIQNLADVFSVEHAVRIEGKRILLVDDVYTTGSTIDSCSKILMAKGAKEINFATLASTSIAD